LTTFLEENTGFLDILNGTFLKFVISSWIWLFGIK
jgi:hypothetical protein